MNKTITFLIKATAAHFVTYFVCGVFFSALFDYKALFELDTVKYLVRNQYNWKKRT